MSKGDGLGEGLIFRCILLGELNSKRNRKGPWRELLPRREMRHYGGEVRELGPNL